MNTKAVDFNIDNKDPRPLYLQLKEKIANQIISGRILHGQKITPGRKLAQETGLSYDTVEKAIEQLVREGLLYRRKKRGTFVITKENIQSNKSVSTYSICVITAKKNNIFHLLFGEILSGIRQRAKEIGLEVLIATRDNDSKSMLEFCKEQMKRKKIKAFAIDKEGMIDREIVILAENKIPFILINSSFVFPEFTISSIMADTIGGAYKATEYLIKLGHKRIGFISKSKIKTPPIEIFRSDSEKIKGYQLALDKHSIELNDNLIADKAFADTENIRQAVKKLLKVKPQITAIFTADDFIAAKVLDILKENNVNVPEDMSIIGFGDLHIASATIPALTTVKVDFFNMGIIACDRILKVIQGEKIDTLRIQFDTNIIERDSCACFNQRK